VITIDKLLKRIQWDKEFGRGRFTIGYYDRVKNGIVRVSFEEMILAPGLAGIFQVMDAEGTIHSVPLHRIREVYRNSELIWHRPGPAAPAKPA